MSRVRVCYNGYFEGVWVKQGEDYVVLLNNPVFLHPLRGLGAVLPSTNPPGSECEVIDLSYIQTAEDIELHPELWGRYVTAGFIGFDGEVLDDQGPYGDSRETS